MHYKGIEKNFEERKEQWDEVENLVMSYQKQFEENASEGTIKEAKKSADELLSRFNPLFNKYVSLLTTGQIDWNNAEMKSFVANFIEEPRLKKALYRKKQKAIYRTDILYNFNFIIESYGKIGAQEIYLDMQSLFLIIAKRYKQMGKNFCAYVMNSYKYEVTRHIKKIISNPLNIKYKIVYYEDDNNGQEESYEDNYYENSTGIPNLTWIQGLSCSDIFLKLSLLERKILVKYYLEEWKDGQIAEHLGMHINTVNQKRRTAAKFLAEELNIDIASIRRTRKSGKKAILPSK